MLEYRLCCSCGLGISEHKICIGCHRFLQVSVSLQTGRYPCSSLSPTSHEVPSILTTCVSAQRSNLRRRLRQRRILPRIYPNPSLRWCRRLRPRCLPRQILFRRLHASSIRDYHSWLDGETHRCSLPTLYRQVRKIQEDERTQAKFRP